MRTYIKYICAVLLIIGTCASAWGATYTLVTSWDQLSTGDVVILANSGKNGSVYVMGPTLSSDKYQGVSVTNSSGTITTTSAKELTVKFNSGTKQAVAFCTGTGGSDLYPESYWLASTGSNNKITTATVSNTFDGASVSSGNNQRYCWKTNGTFTNHSANCVNMQNTTDDALYLRYNSGFCASSTSSYWYVAIFKKSCSSPFGTLSVGGGATATWSGSNISKTVTLSSQNGSGAKTWTLVNTSSSVATISGSGSSATVTIKGTGGAQSATVTVKCSIAEDASGGYCAEEQTITITVNAKSYTYTYKPNGGTPNSDQTQTVYHGVTTTLKSSSTFTAPSCKQFSEWNSNSSGTGTSYSAGASITPTGALTFHAKWGDLGPYTVTTAVNPAASGTATIDGSTSKSCACGATGIALVATPASGYYFNNWTKSPNTTAGGTIASANSASTTYSTGTAAATLTANFLPYLTLTYDANDGTGAPAAKTDCQSGVSFTLSSTSPTRDGYTFQGWNTSSTATTAQKQPGESYSITGNTTLYAVWCKTLTGASLTVSGTTPTFNYSTGKGSTTFSWGSVTGATAYQLVILNTTDDVQVYSGSVSASSNYTFDQMVTGKTYRATVTASNACTNTSGHTDQSIACPAMAGTPAITLPGTIGKTSVTIEFTLTNAVSFNVWLTNGDGSSDLETIAVAAEEIAATSGVASKTFTISADQYYYVHATAKNICGSVSSENSKDFQSGHEATYDHYQFTCVDFAATVPSGKALITSGYDGSAGKTILAKNPVHIEVTGGMPNHYVQIEPSDANVTVYFVKDGNYQVVNASNQLRIANDGTFVKDIYFAYAPTSHGDGSVTIPTFTVRCDGFEQVFNADGSLLKVRSMPNSFAIAAKVGNTWHVLPADMGNSNGTQKSKIIRVDDNTNPTTAYTDDANAYRLWPIKGPTSDDFKAHGSYLRFSMPNNSNYALGASSSGNTEIGVYDGLTLTASNGATGTVGRCNWDVTTTEEVSGGVTYFKYTLNHPYNTRNLVLSSQKWGMFTGDATELRFLKIEEINEANLSIMEWGANNLVFRYPGSGTIALTGVSIDGTAVGTATMERIASSDLYTISGLSTLQANPSKLLQIVITETVSAVNTDKESIYTIPFIIANGETRNNTYLRDLIAGATTDAKNAIAQTVDVVVRQGGKFETTNTTSKFKDLYIYPGGKAELGHNVAHLENIYLRGGFCWLSNDFALPQLKATDDITITGLGNSGNGVFYDLYLNNSIYYMMALPKDVALGAVTNEEGSDDWTAWVKGYSGKPRSLNPQNKGWGAVSGSSLERGKGYEIAIKPRLGRPYGTLRFPLQTSSAWSNETACSPSVVAWGMTGGELNEGVTANNAGWNLIGNPFYTAYNNSGSDAILVADSLTQKLDDNGNWTGAYNWDTEHKVKYFTIPSYTTEDYKDVRSVPYKLDAFYPFFVQVNSGTEASPASLVFVTANRALKLPKRYSILAQPREVMIDFTLTDENDNSDVAGLDISDEYSAAFDSDDKEKTILGGENYMKVYTIVGAYRVAFNSLPEINAAQPIPVGVITPSAGYYTFSLVEDLDVTEVEHVWLTDYEKSSQTDLLLEDYSFYGTPGQLEDRFAIHAVLKNKGTTVDIEEVGADDVIADKPLKFIYQGQIYIMLRGVIYDITGRRVANQ
ncbi:MAG: InlB B-repeat-containing protein [Paludibacteraceae bacterium]|nr:InlB B-repeat-containing protein [Paludibacteraceae bacterium]